MNHKVNHLFFRSGKRKYAKIRSGASATRYSHSHESPVARRTRNSICFRQERQDGRNAFPADDHDVISSVPFLTFAKPDPQYARMSLRAISSGIDGTIDLAGGVALLSFCQQNAASRERSRRTHSGRIAHLLLWISGLRSTSLAESPTGWLFQQEKGMVHSRRFRDVVLGSRS